LSLAIELPTMAMLVRLALRSLARTGR